jgi:hypothetical protein
VRALEILLFTLAGIYQGVRQDWNILEIVAIALALIALRRGWLPGFGFARGIERTLARWSRRRAVVCIAAGTAAVAVRLVLIPTFPVPTPTVTDEFSHLLLADTLLHGRVANPTHPLWPHFESLHIIEQPHYVSNYFPGQGAVLAAGRWAAGSPWAGVLLLSGIFAAVVCWSLQGWMPARWALLGGVIAILRFSIGSYWMNALHGGFLPAIGGALIAGSYPRIARRPRAALGVIFGAGLAILTWSRPYEGALFAAPFVIALVPRPRALLTASLVAGAAILPLGVYFERITGSPLVTPYQISRQVYGWPMTFAWAKPPVIHHTNPELKFYYEYELHEYEKVSSPASFLQYLTFRVQEYWRFFAGPMLTVCLIGCGWVFRRHRFRVLLYGGVSAFIAVMLEGAASPHYLAPATVPILALITLGLWRMRSRWVGGVAFSRLAVLTMAGILAGRIAAGAAALPYTQSVNFQSWCCKVQGRDDKQRITAYLEHQLGRHLVIVRSKTDPYNFFQWIYNEADIDSARIVWARDLGEDRNRVLRTYFRDRTVWMVDPNFEPATLERR